MLNKLNLGEVLFLDIETVPQFSHFHLLSEADKKLWEEKSKFNRERRNLELAESYEEAGIYAEFGKIICISVGFFSLKNGRRDFRVASYCGDDEHQILLDFAQLLRRFQDNPFKLLCAHNGKEFDFPYLCRRMLVQRIPLPTILDMAGKKPWEIPHLDTLELWKFGDYKHYTSLKLLAHIFNIPTPKDDIDGSEVRTVFYEEKNISRIATYCMKDVITVARILLAYKGDDPLQEEEILYSGELSLVD
jgi:DNA polymerase elongation subunit (family B)